MAPEYGFAVCGLASSAHCAFLDHIHFGNRYIAVKASEIAASTVLGNQVLVRSEKALESNTFQRLQAALPVKQGRDLGVSKL